MLRVDARGVPACILLASAPEAVDASTGWEPLVLGAILLLGFVAHVVGQRIHVPRVTLLLLLGLAVGPAGLDVVPSETVRWFPLTTQVALSMVGFHLGEQFIGTKLRDSGRTVVVMAIVGTLGTAVVMFGAIALVAGPVVGLLLAAIGPATDPAAAVDVIHEGRARGPVTTAVLGIVALDDAFGVILFSVIVVIAEVLAGGALSAEILLHGAWEVGGAIALGLALGLPMAHLTGRLRPGSLMLIEVLGFVLVCGGAASVLGVSYLVACMCLGATVANRAKHHTRPFHTIEGVMEPFLVLFFLLAGFAFELDRLQGFGLAAAIYVISRVVGKLLGNDVAARLARAPRALRRYGGPCLLPQAGIAIGLGLVVAERFPEIGPELLSTLVGTTVVFEIIGPIAVRLALRGAGELHEDEAEADQAREDADEPSEP